MADGRPVDGPPAAEAERLAGPALPPPRTSGGTVVRAALLGATGALLLGAMVGIPLLYAAYRTGRARGEAAERERAFEKELRVQDEPFDAVGGVLPSPARVEQSPGRRDRERGVDVLVIPGLDDDGILTTIPTEPRPSHDPKDPAAGDVRTWVFGPSECARIVWPMEVVPSDDDLDRPHFRLRQGANRFATRGTGLAEFVFGLARASRVGVYVRARYSDECGNSLRCGIDGQRATMVGSTDVFGRWLWECAYHSFSLREGLHRLTLGACEDGVEFEKVVVMADPPGAWPREVAGLEGAPTTPPPVFESMPAVSPTLPAIGALEAGAFATGSIVVGEGHANTLVVHLRLNGEGPASGRVVVRCPTGGVYLTRPFALAQGARSELMAFDLALRPYGAYLMPLRAEVFVGKELVHSRRIDFVRPLEWAFLGPFVDPEGRGLDLELPPDADVARLHEMPGYAGHRWKVVRDGSCYDAFGLVDLNRAFGLATPPWTEDAPHLPGAVAYAVTAIYSHGSRHDVFAFGGDDAVRLWLNGSLLLEARGGTPMELNRQIVGAPLRPGANFFAFKVAQRAVFWQLLMEPDNDFPYGRTDNYTPLPVARWLVPVDGRRRGRPFDLIIH